MSSPDKARDAILSRLEKAVSGRKYQGEKNVSGPFIRESHGSPVEVFKENLAKVNGEATIIESVERLGETLLNLLDDNQLSHIACLEPPVRECLIKGQFNRTVGESVSKETTVVITGCESLVASLGSVLVSSAQAGSRKMFVLPPLHIVIGFASQITDTLEEAYGNLIKKYGNDLPSLVSVITGPSRTADIEKTLVLGAHGPAALLVIVVQQES